MAVKYQTIGSEVVKVIKMRFIRELSLETISILKRIYHQSRHFEVRRRTHCILLSFEGFTTTDLMAIFKVSGITIYNWFSAWEESRLVGLYSQSGRGRKPLFTPEQKVQIKEWVKENPKNLNWVINKTKETWNITTSKDTIKRILKSFSMTWYRVRKIVFGEPDSNDYKEKKNKVRRS